MMVPIQPHVVAVRAPLGICALPRQLCVSNYHSRRPVLRVAASAAEVQDDSTDASSWIPVCLPEELPKGVRKELEVDGRQVLLFWYRNQIFAIEARSPTEGAYSEGFIKAKFTQDYCIECPGTGSLFSLKDGSVQAWYPNNPFLAVLTPRNQCRPLEIYPVKLAQDAIYVDISKSTFARAINRGGSDSSLENNNVFSVQPTVYFEGMDPKVEQASLYMESTSPVAAGINPVVAIATTAGVAAFATAGTLICIYLESVYALIAFWTVLGGFAAFVGYKYINRAVK